MESSARVWDVLYVMSAPGVRVERVPLDDGNFAQWLSYLTPPAEAMAYERIGFYTALWDAVLTSYRLGKPILLWAMNGHPMACT